MKNCNMLRNQFRIENYCCCKYRRTSINLFWNIKTRKFKSHAEIEHFKYKHTSVKDNYQIGNHGMSFNVFNYWPEQLRQSPHFGLLLFTLFWLSAFHLLRFGTSKILCTSRNREIRIESWCSFYQAVNINRHLAPSAEE